MIKNKMAEKDHANDVLLDSVNDPQELGRTAELRKAREELAQMKPLALKTSNRMLLDEFIKQDKAKG
jgi:hypothetical protein